MKVPALSKPPSRPPPPTRRSHKADRSFVRIGARLAYSLQGFADQLSAAHALALKLDLQLGVLTIFASYSFTPSFELQAQQASASVARHPFSLGGSLRVFERVISIDLGARATLDLLSAEIGDHMPQVVATDDLSDLVVGIGPTFTAQYAPTPWLFVFFDAGVDMIVNRARYRVTGPLGQEELLTPWAAQPRGTIGAGVILP